MSRNGSGVYSLPQSPFVPGTTISSTAVNSDFSDIATALTGSLAANGETPITGQLKFPLGTAAAASHSFQSATDTGMYSDGSSLFFAVSGVEVFEISAAGPVVAAAVPVGSVIDYAGSTAPDGWLLCYGQSLLRTDYADLFTAIGTTFGAADGTHFSLPDLRGRFTVGKDNMGGSTASRITVAGGNYNATVLGGTGGQQNVTLAQAQLPNATLTVAIGSGQGSHSHEMHINGGTAVTYSAGGITIQAVGSGNGGTNLASGSFATSVGSTDTGTLPAMTGTTSSINGNVTQTVTPVVPPSIVLNKIIYTGVV